MNFTDQKLQKEASTQRESYLRSILETSIDAYIAISIDGKIIDANEACYRMLGYSQEELLQKSITDLYLQEEPNLFETNGICLPLLSTRVSLMMYTFFSVQLAFTFACTIFFISFQNSLWNFRKRVSVVCAQWLSESLAISLILLCFLESIPNRIQVSFQRILQSSP